MIQISAIKKDRQEKPKMYIDLNCDLAQSFGVYKNESEIELLPYVTSVNIACGSHAGDPLTIMNALKIASEKNLAVGAHIGYPDIQGFGYRPMQLTEEEIQAIVTYQIGALTSLAKLYHLEVDYVRPHGALYRQAAEDFNVSLNIAKAIAKYNPWLIYVGAIGDNLAKAGEVANIRVAHEILLDKTYNHDGSINFNAGDLTDKEAIFEQLNSIIRNGEVKNNNNGYTKVKFNTIHLGIKADFSLELAQKARELVENPAPIAVSVVEDTSWI